MRLEVIGQRLLTGRLCIAQAAIVATRKLFSKAVAFAQVKACNGASGPVHKDPPAECDFMKSSLQLILKSRWR